MGGNDEKGKKREERRGEKWKKGKEGEGGKKGGGITLRRAPRVIRPVDGEGRFYFVTPALKLISSDDDEHYPALLLYICDFVVRYT